jgi:hypothetical protein
MFGDHLVWSYVLPKKILLLFSVFRTSGRFIWPVWYLLVIYIIGNICATHTNAWRKGIVIAILLFVQVFDAIPFYRGGGLSHNYTSDTPLPLKSNFWGLLKSLSVEHVLFIPFSGRVPHDAWSYIAAQAIKQGLTTNAFWLGRYPMSGINKNIEQKKAELKNGHLSDGDLFVINYIPYISTVDFTGKIGAYLVDNQVVLGRKGLEVVDSSIKSINVKRSTLADYLKHLRLQGSNFIIVMSGREKDLLITFDDITRQEFHNLNIGQSLDHASNINYLSVIGPNRNVFFESQSSKPVKYSAQSSAVFPVNIDVSVESNFGIFPRVTLKKGRLFSWFSRFKYLCVRYYLKK